VGTFRCITTRKVVAPVTLAAIAGAAVTATTTAPVTLAAIAAVTTALATSTTAAPPPLGVALTTTLQMKQRPALHALCFRRTLAHSEEVLKRTRLGNSLKNLRPPPPERLEATHMRQLNGKLLCFHVGNKMVQQRKEKVLYHINLTQALLSGPCYLHADFKDPKHIRLIHIEEA
jgi:hypothetical protein